MGHIVEIFRRHGGPYLQNHQRHILPSHRRTIRDIRRCRTPVMGGHIYQCSHCDHYHYSYHGCGNRHCPQCQSQATRRWVDQRTEEVMPVPYFHLVFTLPAEFRALVRANQKIAYAILFKAAAESLIKLAADKRYLGTRFIGILAVLHTWSRAMLYHPHVHLLVPAVGLSKDGGTVHFSRRQYLVPVKALSKIFRAKFIARIKAALPEQVIPGVTGKKAWVVFCKHLDLGPQKAIAYLGRYLNRVAVSDARVRSCADGDVCVSYRDDNRVKSARLSAQEFLRRYLQHVLPKGFNKVRRYGLFAPCKRESLTALRHQLLLGKQTKPSIQAARKKPDERQRWQRCPQCDRGVMRPVRQLVANYRSRSPPNQYAAPLLMTVA